MVVLFEACSYFNPIILAFMCSRQLDYTYTVTIKTIHKSYINIRTHYPGGLTNVLEAVLFLFWIFRQFYRGVDGPTRIVILNYCVNPSAIISTRWILVYFRSIELCMKPISGYREIFTRKPRFFSLDKIRSHHPLSFPLSFALLIHPRLFTDNARLS